MIVHFLFFNHNPAAPSHNAQHQGSNSYWVRRVTTSWKEDSITWANVPQSDTLHQVQVPNFTSNTQDYEVDVTQLVADQMQFGNYGFFMRLVNESTFRAVVCASSDAADSNHPARLKSIIQNAHRPLQLLIMLPREIHLCSHQR